MNDEDEPDGDLRSIADVLPAAPSAQRGGSLTAVQRRLLEPIDPDDDRLAFVHSVMCQTSMPYRNPGDGVLEWERVNGATRLKLTSGEIGHPVTGQFVPVGLPYGTRPRLILAHLNAEAVRQQSPVIDVAGSMTGFVRRLGLDPSGRSIAALKQQLSRLAACSIRLGMVRAGHAVTVHTQIVSSFEIWMSNPRRQRTLWPDIIQLSADYFTSLQNHAVPLAEADLAALAHSALALDIFAWLAQRLHRVPLGRPAIIPWAALQAQFGPDYDRTRKFRAVFLVALRQVLVRYERAQVEVDRRGLTLRHSPPPVAPRVLALAPPRSP